jgi:hypothetical protein
MTNLLGSASLAGVALIANGRGIVAAENLLGATVRGDYVPLAADGARELVKRYEPREFTISGLITARSAADRWAAWTAISSAVDAAARGSVLFQWQPTAPGAPLLQAGVRLAAEFSAPLETAAGGLAYELVLRSEAPMWESASEAIGGAASGQQFQLVNNGGAATWPVIDIAGGAGGSATILNLTSGEQIVIDQAGGVPANGTYQLFTKPWNRRGRIGAANAPRRINWAATTWTRLLPGINAWRLDGPAGSSVSIRYRDGWL